VLLDLKMPAYFAAAEDEEGIELLRIIRRGQEKEREEKLPVIILTKTDNPENRRLCRQLEANLFLSKPPDAGELKKQIRHLISNT
ncbi:MAG TPA: response regulator, partial [Caldithrix sp.]|nr:response regulator [Caldithrix sp.]